MENNKPHKHAALIKAWADGAKIQYKGSFGPWFDCQDNPRWSEHGTYRIKPEFKPDVVRYGQATVVNGNLRLQSLGGYNNVAFTFDGETGKLKSVEVLDAKPT